MKMKLKKRGGTLIELLLYLAITSGMLVAFVYFTLGVMAVNEKSNSGGALTASAREVFEIVSREIRLARAVLEPAVGSSGATLTLSFPTPASNVSISENAGRLWLTPAGGSALPLTPPGLTVNEIKFTRQNNSALERPHLLIEFTINGETWRLATSLRPEL